MQGAICKPAKEQQCSARMGKKEFLGFFYHFLKAEKALIVDDTQLSVNPVTDALKLQCSFRWSPGSKFHIIPCTRENKKSR